MPSPVSSARSGCCLHVCALFRKLYSVAIASPSADIWYSTRLQCRLPCNNDNDIQKQECARLALLWPHVALLVLNRVTACRDKSIKGTSRGFKMSSARKGGVTVGTLNKAAWSESKFFGNLARASNPAVRANTAAPAVFAFASYPAVRATIVRWTEALLLARASCRQVGG